MVNTHKKTEKRPPVVAVMGHVDHGKTSLLDYIRQSRVALKEAGGITQSIGAYEIEHKGDKITFIDTPGHEAFKAMRMRGATVADVAVLVVAADDGPKPQTEESIKILEESKTPYIVAITKSDSPRADITKVQNELMGVGVYLEGKGGNISWQEVSSKTGEGIPELLDLIILTAEVNELTFDEDAPAKGYVIEAKKDSHKGILVSVILKDGKLHSGDNVLTHSATGKIKILENFAGKTTKELVPSAPAVIIGMETMPHVGDEFVAGPEVDLSKHLPKAHQLVKAPTCESNKKLMPMILKADVAGTLEVLRDVLIDKACVIEAVAGDITEGDVKSAIANGASIVAFRTGFNNKSVDLFAKSHQVKIFSSDIIYELVKSIEEYIELNSAPELAGRLEVLGSFGKKEDKQVVGGKVLEGVIKLGKKFEIRRKGVLLGEGKIINLQINKVDAKEVGAGSECGMLIDSLVNVKIGDEFSQATTK